MIATLPPHACPPTCRECRLRKTGAFTAVKPEVLNFIEGFRTDSLAVAAGGALVRENQTNAKLLTLYSGWAFRYKTMSDGRRQILNFLLPGDLVGLQQEFGDVSAHGIEALTDCPLCVFQNDSLWALFREHPRLGYENTWLSAHEEGHVDDNLLTAGRRNATERVAMLVMHLYRRGRPPRRRPQGAACARHHVEPRALDRSEDDRGRCRRTDAQASHPHPRRRQGFARTLAL